MQLADLRTDTGFQALRAAGYDFTASDQPRNFKMQAELLNIATRSAISSAAGFDSHPDSVSDTVYLVMDSLFSVPQGFEFFRRFPKEEIAQFCRLAIDSRENNFPLSIVCPVCPDYAARGYKMSDGVGISMERVFAGFDNMAQLFGNRNIPFSIEVHVADVEVLEPLILQAAGETQESFLEKTRKTMIAIHEKAVRRGLEEAIRVDLE